MSSKRGPEDRAEIEEIPSNGTPLKAAANLKKHKVSFEEATTIFGDKKHIVIADREHSSDEERSLAIGQSSEGRLLIMCFVDRGDRIRIISARLVERWERREYESANE